MIHLNMQQTGWAITKLLVASFGWWNPKGKHKKPTPWVSFYMGPPKWWCSVEKPKRGSLKNKDTHSESPPYLSISTLDPHWTEVPGGLSDIRSRQCRRRSGLAKSKPSNSHLCCWWEIWGVPQCPPQVNNRLQYKSCCQLLMNRLVKIGGSRIKVMASPLVSLCFCPKEASTTTKVPILRPQRKSQCNKVDAEMVRKCWPTTTCNTSCCHCQWGTHQKRNSAQL